MGDRLPSLITGLLMSRGNGQGTKYVPLAGVVVGRLIRGVAGLVTESVWLLKKDV